MTTRMSSAWPTRRGWVRGLELVALQDDRRCARQRGVAAGVEVLEGRWMLASASTLLQYDFNGGPAWPLTPGMMSAGVVAVVTQDATGTIDIAGGTASTGAMQMAVSTAPASGWWSAELGSGPLALANTETNLGKLTLSFDLRASMARPVKVVIRSYTAQQQPTGALEMEISPAAADAYQHYSVDLSTMRTSGTGTFNPTAPFVSFGYELSSVAGWSTGQTCEVRVDNVHYTRPAYYVNVSTGRDWYDGRSEGRAFKTPQKALDVSQPGDVVLIMEGTYTAGWGIMNFARGGDAAAWVSVRNYPGHRPMLYNEYWSAIRIGSGTSASPSTAAATAYVEIRGLHVRGNGDTANTAYPEAIGQVDPRTNGNGISIDGRYNVNRPHHIRLADNLIEYSPGCGIAAIETDWVAIENNTVRNTSWWTIYGTSGISVLSAYNFDGTSGGYTRLVRNNVTSGNQCFVKWQKTQDFSDGNGIIIDVNRNTEGTPTGVTQGRTLVQNNVSFNNGGSGIHTYKADHVDIVNNTAYMNSASPELEYGQIFSNQSSDNRIYNNIMVAPVAAPGKPAEPVNGGPASYYRNNIYYGGNVAPVMGSGDRVVDPQFAAPSLDPATADFRLRATSPAINGGTSHVLVPWLDHLGNVRNGAPDIGAYEHYGVTPTIVAAAAASPSPVAGNSAMLSVVAGDNDGPAGLAYTWATAGAPPAPVVFAPNGNASAKVALATFAKAGAYSLQVTVTDLGGQSTVGVVNVSVNQTLTSITVAPAGVGLPQNSMRQFSATGYDQFGHAMAPQPAFTWSATGGAINSSGLLTTGTVAGAYTVIASSGGVSGAASYTLWPAGPAGVGFVVNGGDAQRSMVKGVTVMFDTPVSLAGGAVTLWARRNGSIIGTTLSNPMGDQRTYAVSFDGGVTVGGSLPDGVYDLRVAAARVQDGYGQTLSGGDRVFAFHRLFGDSNGDGRVNLVDYRALRTTLGRSAGQSLYKDWFDVDGGGTVSVLDLSQFRRRFGMRIG